MSRCSRGAAWTADRAGKAGSVVNTTPVAAEVEFVFTILCASFSLIRLVYLMGYDLCPLGGENRSTNRKLEFVMMPLFVKQTLHHAHHMCADAQCILCMMSSTGSNAKVLAGTQS